MMNIKHKLLLLLFAVTISSVCSCEAGKKRKEIEKTINEWTGKEIMFPENIIFKSFDKDTVYNSVFEKEYKVFLYVDSVGCLSCNTQLHLWKKVIEEFNTTAPDKTGFIFVFEFKKLSDALYLVHDEDFKYPVIVDMESRFNKLNNFPVQREFQCFLLDKNNKVLLVGNPAGNETVLNLYKQQIFSE